MTNVISFDGQPQGAERPPATGTSAPRIITGMAADEFAAPGAPPLPSTQPVGRAGRASPTLQAGMELCDKRPAVPRMARAAMPRAGVLAGARRRRFAGAARNTRKGSF